MKPEKSDKIHYNRSAPENAGPPSSKGRIVPARQTISGFYIPIQLLYSNPARNSLSLIFAEAWLTDRLGSVFNIGDTQQQTQYTDLQTLCNGNKKSRPWLRRGVRMTHILAISFALSVRLRFHCDSDSEHRRAKIGKTHNSILLAVSCFAACLVEWCKNLIFLVAAVLSGLCGGKSDARVAGG